MKKKDILELKKRLKKDYCTFTKMCGCYVNDEGNILMKFRETFLNLDEDEFFKYMEIAKKVLSGTIGNNILELTFPINEDYINEKQIALMRLKESQLKDNDLLDEFYKSIIDNYDYTGNVLILLFHDSYDVIKKTTDNSKLDESEEIYEYILCAICPVSLSDPGLRYFEEENKIKARIRDWVVEMPSNGFVFPAFSDRSADVNSIMYYTKNAKDPHPELMENTLGCYSKQTATMQKESFKLIIKDSVKDELTADRLFMEVQENLNTMIEEFNATYGDVEPDPIVLSKKDVQNLLIESGVPEEVTAKIEESYADCFSVDIPLAESLLDSKTLKEVAQKRKEENLKKQVEVLQNRLDQVKKEASEDKDAKISETLEENNSVEDTVDKVESLTLDSTMDENSEVAIDSLQKSDLEGSNESNVEKADYENLVDADSKTEDHYDVILKVKPEKVPQIKSQIIDGQRCIIIPINENEQTTVNGLEDLI